MQEKAKRGGFALDSDDGLQREEVQGLLKAHSHVALR